MREGFGLRVLIYSVPRCSVTLNKINVPEEPSRAKLLCHLPDQSSRTSCCFSGFPHQHFPTSL
jgi:hypothetical protein